MHSPVLDERRLDKLFKKKYKEFKRKSLISNPRENVLIFEHMVDDVLHFNSTRIIRKCAVDAGDLSETEIQAHEQVYWLKTAQYIKLLQSISKQKLGLKWHRSCYTEKYLK